jgi:ferredoxin
MSAAPTGRVGSRVWVDTERCQGHGRCYDWFPELFGEGADGHAVATEARLDQDQAEDVQTAAGLCPESAISLLEDA